KRLAEERRPRGLPHLRDAPLNAILRTIEESIAPMTPAFARLGIGAYDVPNRLQPSQTKRLAVLRSKQNLAISIPAHLRGEFGKCPGVGQIDDGVWFGAMPVAARDQWFAPHLGQLLDGRIFAARPKPVQFDRMDPAAHLGE